MAINLATRYPGRANPADSNYPQGSFKNRSAPGVLDGSYLEKDWANDTAAFLQALISRAGITINNTVDNSTNSQYYTALRMLTNTPSWVNTVNYTVPSLVFGSNGQLYIALLASGPSTTPRDPVSQPIYWRTLSEFLGLAQATETVPGIVEKATVAEAQTFVADKYISADRLRDAFNATGSAPFYAGRAWVNFNGTGTPAIRASGNVSSITDNGTGDYTVNFTTALPDANYVMSGSTTGNNDGYLTLVGSPTTSSCRFTTRTAATLMDPTQVQAIFFR